MTEQEIVERAQRALDAVCSMVPMGYTNNACRGPIANAIREAAASNDTRMQQLATEARQQCEWKHGAQVELARVTAELGKMRVRAEEAEGNLSLIGSIVKESQNWGNSPETEYKRLRGILSDLMWAAHNFRAFAQGEYGCPASADAEDVTVVMLNEVLDKVAAENLSRD